LNGSTGSRFRPNARHKDVRGRSGERRFALCRPRREELILQVVNVLEDPGWSFDCEQLNGAQAARDGLALER
jgi:hypothetical protein